MCNGGGQKRGAAEQYRVRKCIQEQDYDHRGKSENSFEKISSQIYPQSLETFLEHTREKLGKLFKKIHILVSTAFGGWWWWAIGTRGDTVAILLKQGRWC